MDHHSSDTKRRSSSRPRRPDAAARARRDEHPLPQAFATLPMNPLPRPERCQGALPPPVRPRCRRPCCPLPDATASLVRCQHDATASLARCQLAAIPHVGKVGVGVSRPQRTTAMPTSSAIQDAAAATVPAPIRIAYK
ncbi:hypothetical protein ACLOJK_037438 [Asimina triloba]